MKINVNIHPPDGYFFKESDGTTLRANSWPGLYSRVAAYRKRNGLPPGNPQAEVTEQACARSPGNCREPDDTIYKAQLKIASLKGKVLSWLAGIRARKAAAPLSFVDAALAQARAGVCARCPAHAAVAGGCGSCKRALAAAREAVLDGRSVAAVQGCTALGVDCAVYAWLGDPAEGADSLPACCWARKNAP